MPPKTIADKRPKGAKLPISGRKKDPRFDLEQKKFKNNGRWGKTHSEATKKLQAERTKAQRDLERAQGRPSRRIPLPPEIVALNLTDEEKKFYREYIHLPAEEAERRLQEAQGLAKKADKVVESYWLTHELERFSLYRYQQEVVDAFRQGFKIVVMPISNKVGKSRIGAALVHSWALGYEPWTRQYEPFEGAVKIHDSYYRPSSLGIMPPVDITITGEDWAEHVGKTLVPELKRFAIGPVNSKDGEWEVRKNQAGAESDWRHKPTGSTFSIRTYRQDPDLFESFKGHAWWPDEPPTEAIWSGMSRALFMTGGKVFMSMTPIKEAWVFDDLVYAQRADVKTIQNITLWDAPHLYDHDHDVLKRAGLNERQIVDFFALQKAEARKTRYLPETEAMLRRAVGNNVVTYKDDFGQEYRQDALTYCLQNLYIHRFIRDLKDDTERLPRVFGEPRHLLGKVWKNFDYDIHTLNDFAVPYDCPVDFQIDFHPNENIAISFRMVDKWGRNIIVDEVWQHLTNSKIVDEIIRRRDQNNWRLDQGEIDALAKGDSAYARNRHGESEDSFYEIQKALKKEDIKLRVGSKAQDNYIAKVAEWIEHDPPLFFIQKHCKETIRQIERWVYIDGVPSSEGHFPENIGRFSQTGLKWTEPHPEEEIDHAAIARKLQAPLTIPAMP